MKTPLLVAFSIILLVSKSFGQISNFDEGLKSFDAKDYKKATELLRLYADNGNCTAQFVIGYTYQFGLSVEKNDTLAIKWLRKAAEQKQTAAMGPLAAALFGRGIDNREDLTQAYVWGMLAAQYVERQKYTTTRHVIKEYLKEEELETANKLIDKYKSDWKDKKDCY